MTHADDDALRELVCDLRGCGTSLRRLHDSITPLGRALVATTCEQSATAILALLDRLRDEREAHAQLQARCFDYGGTGQNVFDDLRAAEERERALHEAYKIAASYARPKTLGSWERYADEHPDYAITRDLKRADALAEGKL